MKPTFAIVLLAALSPCLIAIERITAAPPENTVSEAAPKESQANGEQSATVPANEACDGCCEKSCCAEKQGSCEKDCCSETACADGKAGCSDTACTDEKPCCENCTAANECPNGDCKSSATSDRIGLKLFWTLPSAPAHKTGISSVGFPQPCPSSPCANSACADSAVAVNPCNSESKVHYAAMPAAVPSPFAKGCASLSAPVLATQAYAATLPLQAPPAPVTQASANLAAPQAATCSSCATQATKPVEQAEATQVLFSVDVIEDRSDSLMEFESLQGDMPFLTADSEIVLATLRILEKQNLLRRVSNPRLITTIDQTAMLQVGTESSSETSGEPAFNGMRMEVAARELGGGLQIEFKFCDTTSNQCYEVATSLLLAHGQTVVMKTGCPNKSSADGAESGVRKHPIYVVLTPQVIK
jgi:hypothetical protein